MNSIYEILSEFDFPLVYRILKATGWLDVEDPNTLMCIARDMLVRAVEEDLERIECGGLVVTYNEGGLLSLAFVVDSVGVEYGG